ncbi:group XIIA secretory phospholipase A2 [Anoplophora glabripennis]|uniref:group XIIA secretory phospholipase A2 n=1 Tax=Anoplophora glabripennis TaxID=217634 RepID=UPI000875385E|nr:group XIIA secretory phospholipase A2 [Anoplophora glabripennis]
MDIPYGKIAIYLLTFLGYIYSGFGSGLIYNLRDAVLAAENVFGDVMKNVINVAQKFRTMHDVFDAAVEEDCVFKCPNGAHPKPNKSHKPSADGCGSFGLKVNTNYLPIGEMTKCCDDHDICYDTCNSNKELCDVEFKRCLYKYCDTYKDTVAGSNIIKACKGTAKMLFTGTLTLGCRAYLDAQKKACWCPSYGWKDKKNSKYTNGADEL